MYYLKEEDLVTLQILLVVNLANIFIMFFTLFLKYDNNPRQNVILTYRDNDNILNTYHIRFRDVYTEVYSDDFPHEKTCSICLVDFDFSSDLTIIKTRNCNHCFHENCLKTWLRIRPTCPNCNNNIAARFVEENS